MVLYLTLGFRQFSHYFTDIRDALDRGDEAEARRLLSEWRHLDASELPRTELMRHVIEHSLLAAHRHVFGVFFWFVLLSTFGFGPAGALLYRMAEYASRYWAFKSRTLDAPANLRLLELSQRLFSALDFVPARLTAFGFAVVGNFEEAVNCWRRDAGLCGGLLDFVAAWYVKAARYMVGANSFARGRINPPLQGIRTAFVSTNSITQGEQAGVLWGWLLAQGIHIHFAHRTFQWNNEARGMAAVHCVIIGFGAFDVVKKTIYEYEDIRGEAHAVSARNINPYLVDAPDVVLEKRSNPICAVPEIRFGNQPIDGGHFILSEDERTELLRQEPDAEKFIRPFLGADEFINNIPRYCLWLRDAKPDELRRLPLVMQRVQAVKAFRLESKRPATKELAATPTQFAFVSHPDSHYLLLPSVSSERRNFIPIGFMPPEVIASNLCLIVPNATTYHFGILTSTMHMAWVRYTCGRLESRYRYSAGIVYNNFPWPDLPSPAGGGRAGDEGLSTAAVSSGDPHPKSLSRLRARDLVEAAAQAVLDARAQFPQSSLADLYDPLTMPPALVKAHQKLDAAVDACYRKAAFTSDAQRVEFLFERYQQLTSLLPTEKAPKKRKG